MPPPPELLGAVNVPFQLTVPEAGMVKVNGKVPFVTLRVIDTPPEIVTDSVKLPGPPFAVMVTVTTVPGGADIVPLPVVML